MCDNARGNVFTEYTVYTTSTVYTTFIAATNHVHHHKAYHNIVQVIDCKDDLLKVPSRLILLEPFAYTILILPCCYILVQVATSSTFHRNCVVVGGGVDDMYTCKGISANVLAKYCGSKNASYSWITCGWCRL